jgi:hypothetical protein
MHCLEVGLSGRGPIDIGFPALMWQFEQACRQDTGRAASMPLSTLLFPPTLLFPAPTLLFPQFILCTPCTSTQFSHRLCICKNPVPWEVLHAVQALNASLVCIAVQGT